MCFSPLFFSFLFFCWLGTGWFLFFLFSSLIAYVQNVRYAKKCLMLALFANAFWSGCVLIACHGKKGDCVISPTLACYSIRYRTLFRIKLTEDYFLTNVKCFIFVFFARFSYCFPSLVFFLFFLSRSHSCQLRHSVASAFFLSFLTHCIWYRFYVYFGCRFRGTIHMYFYRVCALQLQ